MNGRLGKVTARPRQISQIDKFSCLLYNRQTHKDAIAYLRTNSYHFMDNTNCMKVVSVVSWCISKPGPNEASAEPESEFNNGMESKPKTHTGNTNAGCKVYKPNHAVSTWLAKIIMLSRLIDISTPTETRFSYTSCVFVVVQTDT